MMLYSKKIFLFDLEQNSGRNTRNKNLSFMNFFGFLKFFFVNLISDSESASNFDSNGSDPIFGH